MLVTGAGGFIGSHLAERLVELGANVRALTHYNSAGSRGWLDSSPVRQDIEMVAGDIRDLDSIDGAFGGVDVVFHLAALIGIPYSYSTPLAYTRTNVEGTLNVLDGSRRAGVGTIVHTSTSETYGSARYVPMDEKHPLQAQSPYAASKIGADAVAEAFCLSFGTPVVTVRPFNTYGPRQSARAVLPTIITQALAGSEVRLGNIKPTRDLNFVLDTVEGFVAAAEHPEAAGRVFNLGSGRETSIGDLADLVIGIVGRDVPVVMDDERLRPAASEVDRLCSDARRAHEILGWKARYSLEEGLTATIEWVKNHLDIYRSEEYAV